MNDAIDRNKINIVKKYDLEPNPILPDITTFNLYPEDQEIKNRTYLHDIYDMVMQVLNMEQENLEKRNQKENQKIEISNQDKIEINNIISTFNVKILVDNYNKSIVRLINQYNDYMDQINRILNFDMPHAIYKPLILEDYNLPIGDEFVRFINNLKDTVINLHKKVNEIPSLIPQLQSLDEIETLR